MAGVSKEKLEEIFKVYDEQRNGSIKTIEIGTLIRSARLFPSEDDIEDLKRRVDPNRQGTFNMHKFVEVGLWFSDRQSSVNHEQQLFKAFTFFDQDESGTITEGELKKIMSSFNKPLSEDEVKEILKYAKVKDGRIYYKDFIKTILTGKFE